MKKMAGLACISVALCALTACAKAPAEAADAAGAPAASLAGKKVLVAYYSYSGNTGEVAKQIARLTGGTLFEITTDHKYPQAYRAMTQQAKKEIQEGFRPALTSKVSDMAQYDVVFVGSPNWWGTYAPETAAFLDGYDFKGKTVIPFFTHGGGGMQNCERDMKKQLSGIQMLPGITFYGSGSGAPEAELSAWLKKLGF